MGPRMFIRGNVGTRRTPDTTAVAASMGPRMFIRGNLMMEFSTRNPSSLQWGRGCSSAETRSQRGQRQPRRRRFNGAADVHPRKQEQRADLYAPIESFNGAADVHPRKPHVSAHNLQHLAVLQWGRGCSSAETTVAACVTDL